MFSPLSVPKQALPESARPRCRQMISKSSMMTRVQGVICLLILCGILAAGLWPFHSPKNEVAWLGNENGLLFGDYGTVLSSGTLKMANSEDRASCSLEIWLQPGLTYDTNTFLAFYAPQNPRQFSLHQSNADFELRSNFRNQRQRIQTSRLYVDGVFQQGKPVFMTVTSGAGKTAVYIDGTLVKASRDFLLSSGDCTGQLVVGDSPGASDSWSGRLLGLAIYDQALTAQQVFQHHETWIRRGQPELAQNEGTVALYLFDEHTGRMIHNQIRSGADLDIPETYMIVNQMFLERPWDEFFLGWGYWKNVLINIGGFIPLGFFFCAYLSLTLQARKAAVVTIILGCAASLTIEVLQAFLPTRQSGMTDVITNTLGTSIGVALFRCETVQTLYRASLNFLRLAKPENRQGVESVGNTRMTQGSHDPKEPTRVRFIGGEPRGV